MNIEMTAEQYRKMRDALISAKAELDLRLWVPDSSSNELTSKRLAEVENALEASDPYKVKYVL